MAARRSQSQATRCQAAPQPQPFFAFELILAQDGRRNGCARLYPANARPGVPVGDRYIAEGADANGSFPAGPPSAVGPPTAYCVKSDLIHVDVGCVRHW